MKTRMFIAVPVLAVTLGISSLAFAQYGDSPGRSNVVEGWPQHATNTSSSSQSDSVGQYIDDATITAKVKAALIGDSQLKATNVSVETTQGTVQLTGTVNNDNQKSEAERVANRVGGVKSVQDLLKVQSSQEQ